MQLTLAGLVRPCSTAVTAATAWGVAHPPFTATDSVPYAPLEAVTVASAASVWVVGQDSGSPLIEHWDGSAWSQGTLPAGPCSVFESDCALTGVSASSARNVIAVGSGVINGGSSGWISEAIACRCSHPRTPGRWAGQRHLGGRGD